MAKASKQATGSSGLNLTLQERLLKLLWFTPGRKGWGLNMIFWGDPGIAKSSVLEATAAKLGLDIETLSPGERGEGAFGVVPVPVAKPDMPSGHLIVYPPPEWAQRFFEGGGVVFVDELNLADRHLQPPLLGLLNDRRIGGSYLGPRARMVAAANPTESSAGGMDLPAATANRLGHMDWVKPTPTEFRIWGSQGAHLKPEPLLNALDEEARVMSRWAQEFGVAFAKVGSYVEANSGDYHRMPKASDPQASRAWASPRSWEMAARAIAGCEIHGEDVDTEMQLLMAYVGTGAAKGYGEWITKLDLPNPADVLDGKVTFRHDPERLDRSLVVYSSCAAVIAPKAAEGAASKLRSERAKTFWGWVADDANPVDVLYPGAKQLSEGAQDTYLAEYAKPALRRLGPAFIKAGIRQG